MPTIAFFGATGDCAGYCLANTLNAGYDCIALARTPSKLTKSMEAKGVSAKTQEHHLTIIEGNVKDILAVKRTLQPPNGEVVDKVVSGIGSLPKLQWSITKPVLLIESNVCQDAGATILRALQELKPAKKPVLVNISSTGMYSKGQPRDIPVLYIPFYHWMLQEPHEDKKVLEAKLAKHVQLPVEKRGIECFVNVKPTLLMNGEGKGLQAVRQGVDERPAIGYTVQRKDVGLWMFERLVKPDGVRAEWVNKSVSLTY